MADFQNSLAAYGALAFRGGLQPTPEVTLDRSEPVLMTGDLYEVRKYRLHRKIERNHRLAEMAKALLGTTCQVCGFDFSKAYGAIGEGFIEAHHLQPISRLEEGVAIALVPEKDFAVLCSNCHRMIHRLDDPSDLADLRNRILLLKN
jgi:5-methylcytosine-specific restriction protein A